MADPSPLIVPIDLQALLVSSEVRAQNFQRWTMNYGNLARFESPEPAPFNSIDASWPTDPANDGVWLHWRLPSALRHGSHDPATSTTTFPLVPNRWVVLRYSGPLAARQATAWIVESDFLDPNADGSAWIDPFSPAMNVTRIGKSQPLAGWSETNTNPLFLTAVGPGNINFSMYQPYVNNVFSIHDPLTGVADGEILSYLVAGWYSDPANDILAGWDPSTDFAAFVAGLGWSVSEGESATVSIYEGFVLGLQWNPRSAPPSNKPDLLSTPNSLAVGNTAIDALTALIDKQIDPGGLLDPELLQAFQYDLLRLLDQPDGQGLLDMAIHQAAFGSFQGGYVWQIVDAPSGGGTELAMRRRHANAAFDDPPWRFTLNQAQAAYDAAARELASLQWQLYAMWWKRGYAGGLPSNRMPDGYLGQLDAELNPAIEGNLINQVQAATQEAQALQQQIPWGNTPEELAASIARFAADHGLPPTQQLRRSNLPAFSEANDPVAVIAGAKAESIISEPDPLPCRFQDQRVTGLDYDGKAIDITTLGASIPTADLSAVPAVIAALVDEFFFLDPNDATIVAAVALGSTEPSVIDAVQAAMAAYDADLGTVPALIPAAWSQPWSPLFLMWQATFYPIPFETEGIDNWTFDGSEYTWTGNGADTTNLADLSGRMFLTPSCSFNLEARIAKYLQDNPDASLGALEAFVEQRDGWDFLSQTLSGFNEQLQTLNILSLRAPDDPTVLYPPDVTLAALVGPGATAMPPSGPTQPERGTKEWPPSKFQQLRAGQLFFVRVTIVDRFGQGVEIVNQHTFDQFAPVVAPEMAPQQTVLPQEPYRFVQTPPRLLQPGRLAFDFVSANNDGEILDLDEGVNPICAWILPNHLDEAIACYDPAGNALGEAYVVLDDERKQVVDWFPAPNSAYPTIGSLAKDFPNLAGFLLGVQTAGATAFEALLRVIDETLWTIDPLGARDDQYLSVLVGRPLALVRTFLRYQLDGPPLADPGWEFTFDPVTPEYTMYNFPVRLGDVALRDDGTIGYFVGTSYAKLNSVYVPDGVSDPYITPIGPANFLELQFNGESSAVLTILVDPRAPVHAFTGILPVTSVSIPQSFIATALSNMNVTFRVGPLLSNLQVPQSGPPQVVLPLPAEKSGVWSWIEKNGELQVSYGIAPAIPTAQFPNSPPTLRTGWLQLAAALNTGGGS